MLVLEVRKIGTYNIEKENPTIKHELRIILVEHLALARNFFWLFFLLFKANGAVSTQSQSLL